MPPLLRPTRHALTTTANPSTLLPRTQTRSATLLRRPKRPYTFTQLLALSDGSTVLHRSTSPAPLYRSSKDTRNTPLWNPSNAALAAVEEDEAGRLRAFRRRFGRGWDAEGAAETLGEGKGVDRDKGEVVELEADRQVGRREGEGGVVESESGWSDEEEENLLDLISSYGLEAEQGGEAKGVREEARKSGKGKGGEK